MTFLIFIVSWMVLIFVGIPIAVSLMTLGGGAGSALGAGFTGSTLVLAGGGGGGGGGGGAGWGAGSAGGGGGTGSGAVCSGSLAQSSACAVMMTGWSRHFTTQDRHSSKAMCTKIASVAAGPKPRSGGGTNASRCKRSVAGVALCMR